MSNQTNKKKILLTAELAQINTPWRDLALAQDRIQRLIAESQADLLVFPEACSSGFDYNNLSAICRSNQTLLDHLLSRPIGGKGLILPLLIQEGAKVYNRTYFIHSGRIITGYDKIHLIPAMHEDAHLASGRQIKNLSFLHWKLALATCFDLRFPELFRNMKPVPDLIVVTAMWPAVRRRHLLTLARARSIENQTPLLLCNATGQIGQELFAGCSCALDARGESLGALGKAERILTVQIDHSRTLEWRKSFPLLRQI